MNGMEAYSELKACRASGSDHFVPVLNLGHQVLTGVFPKSASEKVTRGPLELVWCPDSGLLQLKHTYNAAEMYGANYGYRSGYYGGRHYGGGLTLVVVIIVLFMLFGGHGGYYR